MINDIQKYLMLLESTGGIARRWIEVQQGKDIPFIHNTTKEVFQLVNLIILPRDPELRYEDTKESRAPAKLDQAIQGIVDGLKPTPQNVQIYGIKNGKAAIIAVMQTASGETQVFIKKVQYKRSAGPNAIFWQTTDFAKDTGLWAQTAQMKKAAIPIEPTDFITPGNKYSVDQLINEVQTSIKEANVPPEIKTGLPVLLKNILTNSTTPVPGLAEFQSAIEIKLSELAVPIALKSGNFVGGDYEKVRNELLKAMDTDWSFATAVSFPAKAEKLIDATLYFGDEKIDISVKDSSGGARPSTATIAESLEQYEFNPRFKKKYANELQAIEILNTESAISGPLLLAKMYGALTDSDITFLNGIYGKGIKNVPKMPKNWTALLKQIPYNTDTTHPEYQLGYHLLAVAARFVAIRLNEDENKITDFFKEVLSKSKIIQVYAKTKADATGGLHYNKFSVVWPPVFEGTIEVDADSYTGRTKPSRKVSFSFGGVKKSTPPPEIEAEKPKRAPKKPIRHPGATAARKRRGIEKSKPVGRAKR